MSDKATVNSPLRPIEWLAGFLGVSKWAAYEAVKKRQIPTSCVVRLGRRLRVNEELVRAWSANQLPAEVVGG